MGLGAPEDGGERDAAARDGDAQDASHTMPDAHRDRSFDVGDFGKDGEERDAFARDAFGAADGADEPGRLRDSSVDTARGSEGGHDAPPHGGTDSSVVADVADNGDGGVNTDGDANGATDPPDAQFTDARIDLPTDGELDVTVHDVIADDIADTGVDMGADITDAGAHTDGLVCGFAPPGLGGPCPAVCNDGCVDGTCRIGCGDEQQCKGSTLECPAGFTCEIRCAGKQSCDSASLLCPELHACTLFCTGEQSCKALELDCRSGTCAVECLGDKQACDAAVVNCGSQACTASCPGSEHRPTLNCGQSCDCRPCR
jgi:hypothetical protein